LLDNLDLSQFNMKHDVLPRILAFDQVTLRRMTTMALDIGKYPPSYASCPVCDLAKRPQHVFTVYRLLTSKI
jgi:hypothetical protein